MIRALFAVSGCLIVAAGCDLADDCTFTKTCPVPAPASSSSNACPGACVPADVSASWSMEPWLVWFGEMPAPENLCKEQVPQANEDSFEGTATPVAKVCPACTCSTPSGSCDVATVTESTAGCMASMPGATFPLAPPSGWDGSCLALTSASGVAVTASATVAPLVIHDACTPQTIADMKPPPPPQALSYAHGCEGFTTLACPNGGDVCMPALPGPNNVPQGLPGGLWTYCLFSPTETPGTCPPEYPISRNFGSAWTTQTCTECTCTAVGSSCVTATDSLVTFYSDDACTSADELGAVVPQTSTAMCVDVPSPVGSMAASLPAYLPGTCTADGGDVVGGPPTAAEPMAFCCQE